MNTPWEIDRQENKVPNLNFARISEEKNELIDSPDQTKKKEKKNGFFQTSPFGLRKSSSKTPTNISKEKSSEIISADTKPIDKEQFELLRQTCTFELNLNHLSDDSEVYGRTLAYCGEKFLQREIDKSFLLTAQTLTLREYLELKTLQLNMLQKQKILNLQKAVSLLNIQYVKEVRNLLEHQNLLLEITCLIELIMRTSPESCQASIEKLHDEKWSLSKNPFEVIWKSWTRLVDLLSDCLVVKSELMATLNLVKILSDDVFKSTKELEVFNLHRLPALPKDADVICFLTENYLKALFHPFLNQEMGDKFIQEYMLHHTKTSNSRLICVRDLFDYLHAKKIKQANQRETRLVIIESLLADVFKASYNDFVEKLTSNPEHSQKFII